MDRTVISGTFLPSENQGGMSIVSVHIAFSRITHEPAPEGPAMITEIGTERESTFQPLTETEQMLIGSAPVAYFEAEWMGDAWNLIRILPQQQVPPEDDTTGLTQ
jgi:hypothetical protein